MVGNGNAPLLSGSEYLESQQNERPSRAVGNSQLNRTDPTKRFRLLGTLPLIFFIAHFFYLFSHGRVTEIFWICHLSNLILSIGLLFNIPALIRLAVIWLVPGLLLWLMEIFKIGDVSVTSFFSHVGG